jgi:hypothetical protein
VAEQGRHSPWHDAVNLNALACPFIAERLGHLHNACLGRGIGRAVYGGNKPGNGGDIDDFPWAFKA